MLSGRSACRLTLWAGLLALGGPSSRLSAQIAAGPEVVAIRFEGNAAFPRDSLVRAIVTRQTECRSTIFQILPLCPLGVGFALDRSELRARELPLDRVRLEIWYQRRGFRDVEVDSARVLIRDAEEEAEVFFEIREGTPVLADSIEFLGAEGLDDGGLFDGLALRTGGRLSTLDLDATRDTLIHRLQNRGYAHADVLRQFVIPADDRYRARVTYEIDAGARARYSLIAVTGNDVLSDATVRRTIGFNTGDPYRVDQLLEGQARLFGLEIIRSASVTPNLDVEPDSLVPVFVDVQEGDAYRVRAGSGWTTAECFNTEARWTSRDFLGGGRRLQVRARVGNILTEQFQELLCWQGGRGVFAKPTWTAAADFSQPWIFSTRNSLSASLFHERQSLPDAFVRKALGLQLALTRRIGPRTPLTLSYSPEISRLDAAEFLFCTNFLVCAPDDIAILQGANWLAPVGLNLTRSVADNLLNPTSGYRLILDLEHAAAWTGSDFRYDRVTAEGTWYSRLGGSKVLAARLRGGWVGSGDFADLVGSTGGAGVVPPQKRFYAGGANSVRGFGQGRLGPRILITQPDLLLLESIDGGAGCTPQELIDLTCDAGHMVPGNFTPRPTGGTRVVEGNLELRFGLGRGFEGVTFTDFGQVWGPERTAAIGDVELTPGVGVRFLSPIGPIRVDLGYRFGTGERLSVISAQIEPAPVGADCVALQCIDYAGAQYIRPGDLAVLVQNVLFASGHFQLHFSIGQAF